MKRQIQELTFQVSLIESVKTSIRKKLDSIETLAGDSELFPVRLSAKSAQGLLQNALCIVDGALTAAKAALDLAKAADESSSGIVSGEKVEEFEVAAAGVIAITVKQSAEALVLHADYHIARVNHLLNK